MAVLHDMTCPACGLTFENQPLSMEGRLCTTCASGRMEILWQTHYQRNAQVHPKERSVVWYSPKEGKHQFPGRNDTPIPDRLKRRGYERKELTSLHSIEQFEKQAKVASEVAWFDSGTGRGFDD